MQFRRSENLAWRRISGDTVVVDIKGNRAFGLNAVGSEVWEALDSPHALPRILEAASAPDDPAARSAVLAFLDDLVGEGLVVRLGDETVVEASFSATADLGGWTAPQVLWREQLEKYAGLCAKQPSTGGPCSANPQFS